MTLLATEIIPIPGPVVVFAADRRISYSNGRRAADRKKVLAIPGKRAGIGYFGLARIRGQYMDRWLGDFIARQPAVATLGEMAAALANDLNSQIPGAERARHVSGFHLAGLRGDGRPEFWFIRNVEDDRQTVTGTFTEREDFLSRDAARLPPNAVQCYRNGDVLAHVAAWEGMDNLFSGVLSLPNFAPGNSPDAYARWVRFKMEVIAHFYQRFSRCSMIGKPIDVICITSQGVREPRLQP